MAEEKEIRIISSEPVLAEILRYRKPIFISQEGWDWIVDWIATIGSIMRSREYIAYNLAYSISYLVFYGIVEIIDALGFKGLSELLLKLRGR